MQHSVFVLYAGLITIALAGNVRLNVSVCVAIEKEFAAIIGNEMELGVGERIEDKQERKQNNKNKRKHTKH